MQDQLNSIKYTSTIVPDDIRKNMLMKKVLVFVQAKEEHPELTKPQLCKMIRISDSSLKRIMKDLNMKSFYRHEVPVKFEVQKVESEIPKGIHSTPINMLNSEKANNIQSVKVKKKYKTGGKPMETKVQPTKSYDVKTDRERMNKELIDSASSFKQTIFSTN